MTVAVKCSTIDVIVAGRLGNGDVGIQYGIDVAVAACCLYLVDEGGPVGSIVDDKIAVVLRCC